MERFPELSESMGVLAWSHPFWATLIYDRMILRVTDEIPTLAVDGKYIYVNRDYFVDELTQLNRIAALAHEVGHTMFFHPQRWATYLRNGFEGQPFNTYRANIAGDLIINAMLKHLRVGELHSAWFYSPLVAWTDSFEDVYRRLEPPTQPQQGGKGKSSGDGSGDGKGGSSGDSSSAPSGPDGGQVMPHQGGRWKLNPHSDRGGHPQYLDVPPEPQDMHIAKDSEISELEWKQSVEAAAIGAKSMGKFPADMNTLVKEYVEVKRNWKQQLRDYFVKHRGRDRRNWRRGNKRKMRQMGIFVPTRHSWKVGNVLVIEDWSGSVGDKESGWFKGTLAAILNDCTPKCLRVLGVTTDVVDDQILRSPAELENWHRHKSGCTDMEAGFRHVLEEGWIPDVAVVLTDGLTSFTNPPPFPVIWVSTHLPVKDFPYGRAIVME